VSPRQARVSIITPAFRAVDVIGATIESVLSQTFGDFEMLVVDDVSPDDTVGVVERYAARDSRVRLLRHSTNQGPAGSRNTALAAATGRYVAFLDSDDLWLPEKLERHVQFMERHHPAISYTQYRRINGAGDLLSAVIDVPDRLDYRGLLKNTAITTSTVIVDRHVTGPFRMPAVFYDDYVCWLGFLKRRLIARGLREDLTRYRVLGGSWSRNKLKSAVQVWRVYRDIERLSWPRAGWAFGHYAWNATRKYRR
jgi:teichuronic acid biosynthesis glycosyltransferase TuaG